MADASLVTALTDALRGRTDVHLAVLFGSCARGTATDRSDVDVAVLGDSMDIIALGAELTAALHRDVDVVSLTDAGVVLLREVLRDGIAVHQSRPGAWGAFIAHSLSDLETDGPMFERMRKGFLRRVAARGLFDEG